MAAMAAPPSSRWLYGPVPDLLVGCGLWYVVAFAAMAVAGTQIREGGAAALMPYLVLLFGVPHYGATLVRVYERAEDRRTYAFFAIHATVLLALVFAFGVHSALVGSWIVTIYLTWSPWHYTGQNYGLAVMFLRRRGVAVTPGIKRTLYASFILSYVMTVFAIHSGADATSYTPVPYDSSSYAFINLGIPSLVARPGFALAAAAYVATLLASLVLLLRRASLADLVPTGALVLAQALWFSIPLSLRVWNVPTGVEPWQASSGPYYFLWIAIAHSVQYIWITSYYARASGDRSGQLPYFGKILLAGMAIWTVPALVFAPEVLGRLPFESGLALLVASAVNIHHFILDGAIWKLRSGRIARVLLRPPADEQTAELGSGRRSWLGRAVWATGAVCLAVSLLARFEEESVTRALEKGDLPRARVASQRLAWIGRDGPRLHMAIGRELRRQGRADAAIGEFGKAIALHPTAEAWHSVGAVHAAQRRWSEAALAFEQALALDPYAHTVLHHLGVARLELKQMEQARQAFARAAELEPDREIHRIMLERAERALHETAAPRGSDG